MKPVDDVLAAAANEHEPKARARRDPTAAERLRRVHEARMNLLREVVGTFCDDPDEVEARSLLAFCTAIGASYLTADHGDQTRQEVLTWATELLLGCQTQDAPR
ncbi:hypothetical protein [Nesterenkonia haasae]|uniref:hypothetical protein n=1 Tax=Nesterenkonia haasae TaxID=2587813 RepID=UPI001391B1B4|nr:hypothetical protein [Nesterenkonia haasae]NDK30611.1 hypothetical protein [Nesterenkonia haasae]